MRISFDIDDTLVCGPAVLAEQLIAWWRRWRYSELLRRGTRSLMQELLRRHCDIWLYTTSYRSPRYLRGWFRSLDIRLGGVVNQHLHERIVGRQGPSKYPPAFGIDLHVDDSEGVGQEGKKHHFAVVVVSPSDADGTSRVLEAVKKRSTGVRRERTAMAIK
jgi:hypothetical protein